ncbi:MgtC/SapB family protein [Gallaecimonas kandeliae]|uniref:MgtC/SapB family protein n=1 Tax=Gallaecimonas kandeliae TaxID=3029055 RepID=UPI002647DDD5|nr:MgtC/SapB family protein [Gallaecimonas kandeliae]WKE65151.1 MgtC/SapB family protein [Gallaecimonas kandeliae]
MQILLALGLGLIIGSERGWQERDGPEGSRVAGIRTFSLLSLTGCLAGLLANSLGPWIVAVSGLGVAGLLAMAHWLENRLRNDQGLTTVVAGLVTWALGVMVTQDLILEAVSSAVITAVLLHLKAPMHRWLTRIDDEEIKAVLQMLVVGLVVLPILPDKGLGPWQAVNPQAIGWLVVLIAAISLLGYFSLRLIGPDKGVMLTSIFGGLASSTAVTLSLSKLNRDLPLPRLLAAGILMACGIMYPRILVVAALVNPALLAPLWLPMMVMFAVCIAMSLLLWRRGSGVRNEKLAPQPFQLWPAVKFGLYIAGIMLLSAAITHWFGEQRLWLVAVAAGLADVDAITVSLSRMALDSIQADTAVQGIVLAAVTNTVVKGMLALYIGGLALGRLVWLGLGATTLAAGLALWLW